MRLIDSNWKIIGWVTFSMFIHLTIIFPAVDLLYIALLSVSMFFGWKLAALLWRLSDTKQKFSNSILSKVCLYLILAATLGGMSMTYRYSGKLTDPTWKWSSGDSASFAWKTVAE